MTADDQAAGTDLAEAERLCRTRTLPGDARAALDLVMAEYDRRGTELDRLAVRAQQHANAASWAAREAVAHMQKGDDLADQRAALSSLLRGMARRATEQRRYVREEYIGRQVAEQNLRYAPIAGIEAYRRAMSAAFFARKPMPPIPEVIGALLDGQETRHA